MSPLEMLNLVLKDLSDLKAVNVTSLDITSFTPLADYMVIATGNSSRHVHSLSQNLVRKMKERHQDPVGIEGDLDDEWVLVDLGDVIIHLMQPRTRDFYNLERLWTAPTECEAVSA